MILLDLIDTLLRSIVLISFVFVGGGLWIIAMLKLWWGVKW